MAAHLIQLATADDRRDVVHRAVELLAQGEVIALPTETVYGLAVKADDCAALEKMFAAKGRNESAPCALAIKGPGDALDYVPTLSPLGKRLAKRCWPGPLTLVSQIEDPTESLIGRLDPAVQSYIAPRNSVGLRVPANQLVQDILCLTPGPVALTSANKSGAQDSIAAEDVSATFGSELAAIFDDGPARFGKSSTVVQVKGDDYEILREGVVDRDMLRRLAMLTIVFVCTGNTCRSPMAEALCRRRLAQKIGCSDADLATGRVQVMSAGVAAHAASLPSPEAVEILDAMKIDLSGHQAQPLSESLARHADIIITMTNGHRDAILSRWPDLAENTFLLRHDQRDVADPIGGSIEVYRDCAAEIDEQLERWLDRFAVPPLEKGADG